jgi:hypothetical protein
MRASLTPRQVAVLQWISDGCAIGAWPDDRHKNSARALESRGLVKISRRNGAWHAALLPEGRYYIEHGHIEAFWRWREGTAATARCRRRSTSPLRPSTVA